MKSREIEGVRQALELEGPAAVDAFWSTVVAAGTPLVEPIDDETSLVTFVWRGAAERTEIAWGVNLPLERLAGTDLWHGSVALPADLRTIYVFAHDGAESTPAGPGDGPTHIDALNRSPVHFTADPTDPTDRDSWASLLELPRAPAEPWLTETPAAARGTTVEAVLDSAVLGGPRHVALHRPAGVPTDGLPLMVVFDGHLARTSLAIPTTVDNLIAAGRIPPITVVFLHTPDDQRERELDPHSSIVEFIADEVLPWAAREWGAGGDPTGNVIAGVSRGGLIAAHVALRRPELFGAVIAQSGSFWWPRRSDGEPEWLTRQYAAGPRVPLRFYLDVGRLESGPGPDDGPSQVEVNRRLRDTLRAHGYPVTYAEYTGGHDYVNWRRTFADGLLAVLGR